jgi:hypothetical protein
VVVAVRGRVSQQTRAQALHLVAITTRHWHPPTGQFSALRTLSVDCVSKGAGDFEALRCLHQLRRLQLLQFPFSDDALATGLAHCCGLVALHLEGSQVGSGARTYASWLGVRVWGCAWQRRGSAQCMQRRRHRAVCGARCGRPADALSMLLRTTTPLRPQAMLHLRSLRHLQGATGLQELVLQPRGYVW